MTTTGTPKKATKSQREFVLMYASLSNYTKIRFNLAAKPKARFSLDGVEYADATTRRAIIELMDEGLLVTHYTDNTSGLIVTPETRSRLIDRRDEARATELREGP